MRIFMASLLVIGASGCLMEKGIGTGELDEDEVSTGAVSAWAEPSGPSYGMGADTRDYLGWTIHFTHASPGTSCSTAPDLTSLGDIAITTAQIDTDSSNQAGHAQRATLQTGAISVLTDYPAAITSTFALLTLQGTSVVGGSVTITNFDDDTIEGVFAIAGNYTNETPSDMTASGTFSATRCLN